VQRPRRRLLAALAIALALPAPGFAQEPAAAGPSPAPAGPAVLQPDGATAITMDFQDVDIAVLVRFIGEITGRNFVMDERVQGKVTVVSPNPITPEEAYELFQAVLQVKGFTTVPSGAAVRIIPTKEARGTSLRTLTDGIERLPSEEYITRLVPLAEVDAADLINVLQPMVSPDGLLTASPHTNALIIVDSAANVQRLMRLIAELDVVTSRRRTELIALKHAVASELAETIQQVLEEGAAPLGRPATPQQAAPAAGRIRAFRITPDDRTNTLVVSAPSEQMRQIRALVASLDVPLPPGSGRIHVHYLKYANAEELLPVLLDVIGAQGGGAIQPGQAPQQAAGPGQRPRRQTGSRLRRAYEERIGRQAQPGVPRGGQTGPAVDLAGDLRITADPATNALIITAAPEDYALLAGVIEKLDIRRRQVYVEAIILEVTLDRMRELGIELQGGVGLPDGIAVGRVNLQSLNPALLAPGSIPGLLAAAVSSRTVTLPDGTTVPAQVALLTALQNDTDVNILSAPNILTTDNEEAEIIVGQNVPFIASRSTSETNLSNVFSTVEREDVGITLRLTPQISEGEIVRLALFEEVSAIILNPLLDANQVGPTTTVRSASTTVAVKDGQTVVIGGLISDSINASERKVPFLGDVPVLGNFFKRTATSTEKINLLIFLTPHIVKDDHDAMVLSTADRDRFRAQAERSQTPKRVPDPLDLPSFEPAELRDRTDGTPGWRAPASPREPLSLPPATGGRPRVEDGGTAAGPPPAAAPGLGLAGLGVERQHDGAVIRLELGAVPSRVTHYALRRPGRYVIDAFGPSAPSPAVDALPVADELVRRVRVARHAGRVRLVLDLATDQPPAYALETHGATIVLKLGAARLARAGSSEP
jgi:general secretion pathway protein D